MGTGDVGPRCYWRGEGFEQPGKDIVSPVSLPWQGVTPCHPNPPWARESLQTTQAFIFGVESQDFQLCSLCM